MSDTATAPSDGSAPLKAGGILATLILVASVANLNLSVANVALPDIGKDLHASQTGLNLVAVGFSLGLAATVLWLGALGDRYGRKQMIIGGLLLSIPACLIAGYANSIAVLFGARLLGGVAAGMAYPTTLALISALWSGAPKAKAIALWSGLGGAFSAIGPLVAGVMLGSFAWGSVFLITLPLALVALVGTFFFVPSHVHESTEPVDNIGGFTSVVMVGAIVIAVNFATMPGAATAAIASALIGFAALGAFFMRQKRTDHPLFDLNYASRTVFWVAAVAGMIVFGSLMGAMFIGQQYLQNVLSYSSAEAGAAILPAAVAMVIAAPIAGRMVVNRGSRFTLLVGYLAVLIGFAWMLIFWKEGASYFHVGFAYAMVGIGVGVAGAPASQSLTASVPPRKAGMASATSDLQRDLGGAIIQSLLGALLTAGYTSTFTKLIAGSPNASQVSDTTETALTKSFGSAADLAQSYPQYSDQIIQAAKESFLKGQNWAYATGMIAVALGAGLVFSKFPKHQKEIDLVAGYEKADAI